MLRQVKIIMAEGCDPRQNLAVEKVLFDTVEQGTIILYLWQNEKTVVIGRNQNAYRECRIEKLQADGGTLVRRLSGGGAVYHDVGNLCFTFVANKEDYNLVRQQRVLLRAVGKCGIKAEPSGRNDLLADGKKFSGNSFHESKGKCFHNGTFLVDVDMGKLGEYLQPSPLKLKSKSIDSVRSRVVNLKELQPTLTIEELKEAMCDAFADEYQLPVDTLKVAKLDQALLAEEVARFSSEAWTLGDTLPCTVFFEERFDFGEVRVEMDVKDGVCKEVQVFTDALDSDFAEKLSTALRGAAFRKEALCANVNKADFPEEVRNDLCTLFTEVA